jgi:hypothetical protein
VIQGLDYLQAQRKKDEEAYEKGGVVSGFISKWQFLKIDI